MKIAFLPIGILGGILAGLIGQKAFDAIWGKFDEQEPPQPAHREVSLAKLAAALVIEGAILWPHTWVDRDARLAGTIAGRHCHFGRSVQIGDTLFGDKSVVTDYSRT